MTLVYLSCAMMTVAALVYIFYLPGTLHLGPEKTRLSYLRERKDSIYENLRDLNFEHKSGKFPDADYESMKASLEDEAAAVLSEMSQLENPSVASNIDRGKKGAKV